MWSFGNIDALASVINWCALFCYFLSCDCSSLLAFDLQGVAGNLQILKKKLGEGDVSALGDIRKAVLELAAPSQLVCPS